MSSVLLVLPLSGCSLFGSPDAQQQAETFLNGLAIGDLDQAANVTDDPNLAKGILNKVREGLKPKALTTKVDQVRATGGIGDTEATVTYNWDFDKDRLWSYQSKLTMRELNGDWKVHFEPSDLHPKLGAQQSLTRKEVPAQLAPVLDRDGTPLMSPETLVSVVLERKQAGDLGKVATALAAALTPLDAGITTQSIGEGAAKADSYTVAVLRQADYLRVKPAIYELPGVRFTEQVRLVAPDKNFGSKVLPDVRAGIEKQLAGKNGWKIVSIDPAGNEVDTLFDKSPEQAKAVSTGLSRIVQAAAEDAVEPVAQPAMLVAIQPSTGDILAVAQNTAADQQNGLPLTGQYPPGSTFKIVTALAALQRGAKIEDQVPCPGETVIDGRPIPNSDKFDLGTVPLRLAFAKSCNTTFATIAKGLPADALTTAATQTGLGVDYDIPGITTISGSVPPAQGTVERAEDGFGQGKVVASPFGMALVAATVARGGTVTPHLLRGTDTKVAKGPRTAADKGQLEQLRPMMRDVVTVGTANILAGLPDVFGKTGTAQFGDGTHSHGWFVGYQGDVAFAALVLDAGKSVSAIETVGRFLKTPR
ncbi:penicillin-binding protein [Pseudonocardiaceae bacterium YIM PH 21723]|nr:penicillin-binding protein [Pseudonocardiaceae bacterium YIM PH 21723]